MDKYKITFVCTKLPDEKTGLKGFQVGVTYQGRAFNGLFQLNAKWGSGSENTLISKSVFNQFFALLDERNLLKSSA